MFDQSRACGDLFRDSTLCLVKSWYSRHVMSAGPGGTRASEGTLIRLIGTDARLCGMTRNSRHQEYACQIVTSSAQDAVISAFSSAAPLKPRRLCISGDWRKPVNV